MIELKKATSLRFFFALWVFLSHCDFILGEHNRHYESVFQYGYVGVGFFFILSGFILSYVYKNSVAEGTISYGRFVRLRLFRLYPLYFLTLLLSLPLEIRSDETAGTLARNFLLHAGMLRSFIPVEAIYFAFNGPSWSVSNEIFFYLLFPILIVSFRKSIMLYVAGVLFAVVLYWMMFNTLSATPESARHYFFYINPVVRLSDFLFGMFLFLVYERYPRLPRYSTIAAIALLFIFFLLKGAVPQAMIYSVLFYLPIGMLILSSADDTQRSWIDALLKQKFLVYLGRISYGLYLYHILTLRAVSFLMREMQIDLSPYIQILLSFLILLAISILSFEFFEKPLNKTLRESGL